MIDEPSDYIVFCDYNYSFHIWKYWWHHMALGNFKRELDYIKVYG